MTDPLDLDAMLAAWRAANPEHDGDRHPFGCESCAIERLVAELRTARAERDAQTAVSVAFQRRAEAAEDRIEAARAACDRILTDSLTGDDAFVVAGEILAAVADPETTP
jgi:hypothetical protein